jgi:sugar O-acyltransferase (sialic acid O-acetyltransferase NeuD family)
MPDDDPRPLILLQGRGGQGRVVLDALLAGGGRVAGILDDSQQGVLHGVPILGQPAEWTRYRDEARFVVAMGDTRMRLDLGRAILEAGAEVVSVLHPGAYVSPLAQVGRGVSVLHAATVHIDSRIGDFCIVNANASLNHDNVLGDGVSIGPGVTFPGGVTVGEGASIGAGAVVLPGRSIGAWAVVGAGAVVTKDVPDGATVAGNPARIVQPRE